MLEKYRDKHIKEKINHSKSQQNYKVKVPISYLYVYFKLREKLKRYHISCFLQTSEVLETLKMSLKIPKRMKYIVLAEMEFYGLLKRINHQKYWISDKKEKINMLKKVTECLDDYAFW